MRGGCWRARRRGEGKEGRGEGRGGREGGEGGEGGGRRELVVGAQGMAGGYALEVEVENY